MKIDKKKKLNKDLFKKKRSLGKIQVENFREYCPVQEQKENIKL